MMKPLLPYYIAPFRHICDARISANSDLTSYEVKALTDYLTALSSYRESVI